MSLQSGIHSTIRDTIAYPTACWDSTLSVMRQPHKSHSRHKYTPHIILWECRDILVSTTNITKYNEQQKNRTIKITL